jgi:uncharacterized protein
MTTGMDKKRLSIFLALAFGIAWLTALIIFLTGGLTDSPQITPGLPLAVVLLAGVYMWAPAIASLLTRMITREGWRDSMLRANLKCGWPFWLAAWVLPAVLTIFGLAVYFLIFPHLYDPDFSFIRLNIPAGAAAPWVLIAAQTLQGIIISPFINGFFTFGEELGWRGYLLPKLMPLGGRRAVLVSGVIWGVWHWPLIAMGHNYGLGYAGWPWLGMLAMVWFTLCLGIFFAWITLRSGSVWPAVIGHAAVNGIAALGLLFHVVHTEPNLLIGPYPSGIIGSVGFMLLALWIFLDRRALAPVDAVKPSGAGAVAVPVDNG